MILAIDLGTTNFKAALFTEELERVSDASLPSPYINNDGNCVEMDAGSVKETIIELIKNVCKLANIGTNSIISVAVASQAQNFTVLESGGKVRCPVISWLDTRSGVEADELRKTLGADWHEHCSFSDLNGQMQLSHLFWLKNNMPEVLSGNFKVMTLPGIVFDLLAGVNITDNNLAAMSGIYSLVDNNWRLDVLKQCGVTAENLPALVPVGRPIIAKTSCNALDLREEISLVLAGNDQTAGAFGNGCSGDDVIATLGTALVAYRRTGENPGPYNATGCWGPYPDGGYYELTVSNFGCLALDWAREEIMPDVGIREFDAAVSRAVPNITESTGLFWPAKMRTLKAWQGDFNNVDEKAYAILEGIAFDLYKLVFEDMTTSAGSLLRVIGGGSHSDVWLQLIADVLNCPVVASSGDSLLGAAAMAAGHEVVPIEKKRFYPDGSRHELLDVRRKNAIAAH